MILSYWYIGLDKYTIAPQQLLVDLNLKSISGQEIDISKFLKVFTTCVKVVE